jgi:hypothetical protein
MKNTYEVRFSNVLSVFNKNQDVLWFKRELAKLELDIESSIERLLHADDDNDKEIDDLLNLIDRILYYLDDMRKLVR